MKPEIEAKFINVNVDDIRQRLKAAGAELEQPMRLMRRVNIEEEAHREAGAWIRVRDEGNKTTLTWKQGMNSAGAIDRIHELEVDVSNFDDTVKILELAGWAPKTYQESKRETWKLGEAEIVIDEWPWLEPMIEIEAADEATVQSVAKQLALDWSKAEFGNIDDVYMKHYNFVPNFRGVIDLAEVRFGSPVPKEFGERK